MAPQAWFHAIFPPLENEDVISLDRDIGIQIPDSYRSFLLNCGNGLKLFSGTLTLDGLRKISGRGLEAAWQPFSLITPNTIERPSDLDKEYLIIGGYGYDDSKLVMAPDGKVYYCLNGSANFLENWDSFEELLLTEISRISGLFDGDGKRTVEGKLTVPLVLAR